MINKISKCRICANPHLELVLDLGEQMLTGVFPRTKGAKYTVGPLRLLKCIGGPEVCGLLQLEHSYDLGEMYGENYGYRSGLNPSMVAHLQAKVARISGLVQLLKGDLVIDVGSNDSTTLQAYPSDGPTLVGIDPTGIKLRKHYPPHVALLADFFSSSLVKSKYPGRKAKVVTSFSMFYDIEDPIQFMREVHEILAEDGVWVFEQSYMPTMLETNSFDTVCHEHLEYYALRQIKWMADKVGFQIVDVEFNATNGGSFSITVSKTPGGARATSEVQRILDDEAAKGLDGLGPYQAFASRVERMRKQLVEFVAAARAKGETVGVIGASTKGNVLLQLCGFTDRDLVAVGEVNADKFGGYTPGTWIPIVAETELLERECTFLLVLPWHFRSYFCSQPRYKGRKLLFPLPNLEVVDV